MTEIFDRKGALERMDGDEELLETVLGVYLDDLAQQLVILQDALNSSDIEVFTRQAHSLKSSSATVGAEVVRAVAIKLERLGNNSQVEEARKLFPELQQAILAFQNFAKRC